MVRSWDCFDTLIARKYHYPKSIFSVIAKKINDPGFYESRILREKSCIIKTLDEIYSDFNKYSVDLELDTEKEYTYPIVENFNLVADGDIVVSDMYLSGEQILELLRYHGLNKDIHVYSTYGGKASGKIWDLIKDKHNIEYHIGDNLYSDVTIPRKYGIKTKYYHNSSLSYQELLLERYCPYLAYWAKHTRLNNPYLSNNQSFLFDNGSLSHFYGKYWIEEYNGKFTIYNLINISHNNLTLYSKKINSYITIDNNIYKKDNRLFTVKQDIESNSVRGDERILWGEQASFNIPILLNAIYALPNNKDIIFIYRDCVYMKMLYDAIYSTNSQMLHASRSAYYYPYNAEYESYLKNNISNKLLIDLHGTGKSSRSCIDKLSIKDAEIMFVCEHCDNLNKNMDIKNLNICFHKNTIENIENTRFNHNKQASMKGLKCCRGTVLEKFNISPGIGQLVGWVDNQPYRRKCEHNQIICNIFKKCVESACIVSRYYKDNIKHDSELLDILLDSMNDDTYCNSVVHSLWDKK